MDEKHLTAEDIEGFIENELSAPARASIDQHLTGCARCRGRVARDQSIDAALRAFPREQPPRDLVSRINALGEWRAAEEHARRARLPLITLATLFSVVLALWFGYQMLVAFQENDALVFFSLFTASPEILAAYSSDALFALLESLPLGEIILTFFATVTVIVLAQQWVDTAQPRVSWNRR